jgi:inward rectifier potassium channel
MARMNFNSPFRQKKLKEAEDLGFGTRITGDKERLIKNGKFNIERVGRQAWTPYQDLVEMSWVRFFLVILVYFVILNSFFACILTLIGAECLNGVEPGSIWKEFGHAWFFSVQTFTTVGYGAISPACWSSNLVAATIALIGLMSFALATGLFFARFAKPKAQIIFSKNAIITPYMDGLDSFQFRIANGRNNQIINVEAKVTMSWVEEKPDGTRLRRFFRLPLELDKVVMLPLNWNLVHAIDENSPLWGKTAADLEKMTLEVIVLIEGFDESFSQTVYAQNSYCDEELLWNVRFSSMYYPGENGKTVLDLDVIDKVIPVK